MKTCEFSEFSFGYALTDSLIAGASTPLGFAPIFPNQIAEGKSGGGYDVQLPLNPLPLFLQFKIPVLQRRKSVNTPVGYGVPYYRMALRTKHPNQHKLLLDLQSKNPLVYYVTPLFDRVADLDKGFQAKNVERACAFIKPTDVGVLNGDDHYVSYKPGAASYWVHSEPKDIGCSHRYEDLLRDMKIEATKANVAATTKLASYEESFFWTDRSRAVLHGIKDWLVDNRARDIFPSQEADDSLLQLLGRDFDTPGAMAKSVGYVAQVHYGITLAFVDSEKAPEL